MKWEKLGHVFNCLEMPSWASNSALTPTPYLISKNIIRVYCSFRDDYGAGQIGFVDVCSHNPKKILKISENKCLSIGRDGRFDDNGMILGDVIKCPDGVFRMYYVGFQKVKKAKFLAFSGLSTSTDGENFTRFSEAPILDRCHGAHSIRAIHSVIIENGIYKIWFAVGDSWHDINGINYPKYNIWYTESNDGISFKNDSVLCIDVEKDEYRIGRPSVIKLDDRYIMIYTKGSLDGKDYFPGVAYSDDGISWQRKDSDLGLSLGSENDFDSTHLCYPRIINANGNWYAFYNGNNMGLNGFGVAKLISW